MSGEKNPKIIIACPECEKKTSLTYLAEYVIDDKNESDVYALKNTEDMIAPKMTKIEYDIFKNMFKDNETRAFYSSICSVEKHKVGGMFSKPCFLSDKFWKVFTYYFIDHEEKTAGFTFRIIEEMEPVTTFSDYGKIKFVSKRLQLTEAEQWIEKGIELRQLENYVGALDCYNEALKIQPNNAGALSSKGVVFRRLGKFDESLECYNKALEIDSEDYKIWFNKGMVLSELGKFKEAISCYDKALELNPNEELIIEAKNDAINLEG